MNDFDENKADGCTFLSWVYTAVTGKEPSFRPCCIEHDRAYHYGGSSEERLEADRQLWRCVRSKGGLKYTILAYGMYYAVRAVGWKFWGHG